MSESPTRLGEELPVFSFPCYANDVLAVLSVNGRNVIKPWGVEFADSSSFFSLERHVGYRYRLEDVTESVYDSGRSSARVIRLSEGLVRLEVDEALRDPRELVRRCRLTCLEESRLMDFVLRYRFMPEELPRGRIAGRDLSFRRSNVYHQFPTDTAAVGNDEFCICVSVEKAVTPPAMAAFAYLRDSHDAWVLHLRMLPAAWDKEVIKLCSRWFGTRPIPQWASGPLLRVPAIRRALWYRGEFRPWRSRLARVLGPNAYPMVRLPEGTVLEWAASCRIEPPFFPVQTQT